MSNDQPDIGSIAWRDLTVADAEAVKAFYCDVVGWKSAPQRMGDYDDYNIQTPRTGEIVAGICHARGENAKIPPQWLMYIVVADVAESARRCVEKGGKVIDGPRPMAGKNFCVIQDPAGAYVALIEA